MEGRRVDNLEHNQRPLERNKLYLWIHRRLMTKNEPREQFRDQLRIFDASTNLYECGGRICLKRLKTCTYGYAEPQGRRTKVWTKGMLQSDIYQSSYLERIVMTKDRKPSGERIIWKPTKNIWNTYIGISTKARNRDKERTEEIKGKTTYNVEESQKYLKHLRVPTEAQKLDDEVQTKGIETNQTYLEHLRISKSAQDHEDEEWKKERREEGEKMVSRDPSDIFGTPTNVSMNAQGGNLKHWIPVCSSRCCCCSSLLFV